jgi:hypothetical protein
MGRTITLLLVSFGLSARVNVSPSLIAQARSDFSGTWALDESRSGGEPEIWLQRRSHRFVRFVIHQTPDEMTLDASVQEGHRRSFLKKLRLPL